MDSWICQTSTASPAEPGGLSFWARWKDVIGNRRLGGRIVKNGPPG